jgi:hypothetical protein
MSTSGGHHKYGRLAGFTPATRATWMTAALWSMVDRLETVIITDEKNAYSA